MLRRLAPKALLAAAVLAAFDAAPAAAQEPPSAAASLRTIVVSGEAVVRQAPDVAHVSFAVETRARAPRDAQQQNAAATAAVYTQLAAAGYGKDDLRTTGYSLQQEFDYVQGKQVSRGFVVRNQIDVRVSDVSKVGDVIDAAVAAGTTSVGNISFDLKNRDAVERDALRLAVADARARADAAAAGAGVAVDRVLKIEDQRQGRIEPPRPVAFSRAEQVQVQTPIEPGQIEITARVTLTVSLK